MNTQTKENLRELVKDFISELELFKEEIRRELNQVTVDYDEDTLPSLAWLEIGAAELQRLRQDYKNLRET